MPIAFPPILRDPLYIKQWWLALSTKAFNMVPAPNLGQVGMPLNKWQPGGPGGWSFDPGIGVARNRAVNLRALKTMYVAPNNTAQVNPAAFLEEKFDATKSFGRVLGDTNTRIIGVSRDAVGAALGTCVVNVFQTSTNILCAQTVSDGSGNWTAYPNLPGPYYFVEYKAGAPDVFGTSPNTNVATTFTPGQ